MRSKLSYRQIRRQALRDDRRALAFEKKFTKVIHRAIMEQVEDYLLFGDVGNSLQSALTDLYTEVGLSFAGSEEARFEGMKSKASRVNETVGFFASTYNDWATGYIYEQVGAKIVGINNTTRERVQRVIDGMRGSEFGDIAGQVRKVMNADVRRSMMIARTEVANMVNATKERSGSLLASETGLQIGKIWIHRGAKNPRDWHLILDDGEVIPKDDSFIVTDDEGVTELMSRPHDPNARAKNVINCGCQVLYVPIDYNEIWRS